MIYIDLFRFDLVSKIGEMTLGLARTFAPNFGKVEKKVRSDGSVETVKLSGLKGIGHAGLTSKCFDSVGLDFLFVDIVLQRFWDYFRKFRKCG